MDAKEGMNRCELTGAGWDQLVESLTLVKEFGHFLGLEEPFETIKQ